MGYTRTFTGYRPGARDDGRPWTQVRVDEAPQVDDEPGTWTAIDTQNLDPIDADPAAPQLRDVTTDNATLTEAFYRLVFIDADGDEQATDPVIYPPAETLRPTPDDVALLLRTRTTGGIATGLGADTDTGDLTTFTTQTRPTVSEVERLILVAYNVVLGELTPVTFDDLPVAQYGQVRHAIALYTTIMIETSFFREQADEAALGIWRELYAAAIARISGAMTPDGRSRRMVTATMASPFSGDDPLVQSLDFLFP